MTVKQLEALLAKVEDKSMPVLLPGSDHSYRRIDLARPVGMDYWPEEDHYGEPNNVNSTGNSKGFVIE